MMSKESFLYENRGRERERKDKIIIEKDIWIKTIRLTLTRGITFRDVGLGPPQVISYMDNAILWLGKEMTSYITHT